MDHNHIPAWEWHLWSEIDLCLKESKEETLVSYSHGEMENEWQGRHCLLNVLSSSAAQSTPKKLKLFNTVVRTWPGFHPGT